MLLLRRGEGGVGRSWKIQRNKNSRLTEFRQKKSIPLEANTVFMLVLPVATVLFILLTL